MDAAAKRPLRPRRLLASGGSRLSSEKSALFLDTLGRVLAAEPGLVLATGGFHRLKSSPSVPSADHSAAMGFAAGLAELGQDPEGRIETLLPENDWVEIERFRLGKVVELRNTSARARRFRLVHIADVVVMIEGDKGSREVIENAVATDTPVLPLPFAGGASAEFCESEDARKQLVAWFGPSVLALKEVDLESLSHGGHLRLAKTVSDLLLVRLRKKCLVCMPYGGPHDERYDEVIRPAIESCDVQPVRLDRLDVPGNALRMLREAIYACDATLVDVTDANSNVLYELGLIHGLDKPAIIVSHKVTDAALPFNIRNERILFYEAREDLAHALLSLL